LSRFLHLFFWDNNGVLNWSSWLGVLSGISDNGRVSLDSSLVHWDFILLFGLGFLLGVLFGVLLRILLGILFGVFLGILLGINLSFFLGN
jgi:hypothetical protein